MRWRMLMGVVGLTLAMTGAIWAEEPGVISPDQLDAAKSAERNTYHNGEYGFSITKSNDWILYEQAQLENILHFVLGRRDAARPLGELVAITRFPGDADWVLFNPSVIVGVYEFVTPATDSEVISAVLRDMQGDPESHGQVAAPPTAVEINGKTWQKGGAYVKFEGKTDLYTECYVHTFKNKFFVVEFSARTTDVPTYRQDFDAMIKSIRLTEPASAPTTPGTKEL